MHHQLIEQCYELRNYFDPLAMGRMTFAEFWHYLTTLSEDALIALKHRLENEREALD